MRFSREYQVHSLECDASDHLNLWGLARYYQEIAELHAISIGNGFSDLIQHGKAWVLCRMFFHIDEMPKEWSKINLTTWLRGTNGLFSMRDYRLADQEGRVLAAASCYWAIIDYETRHVCRLTNLMGDYGFETEAATPVDELRKLTCPPMTDDDIVARIPVLRSFIDHTNHVNNAEYLRIISDYLPNNLISLRNTDLRIDFLRETKPDDTLVVSRKQDNNANWFCISNSQGVSTVARVDSLD
ncbi:MAG: acyl-ACP thioesterase [bacterium P3]|nr:MAG: acyl-ACP thioesterase [bacterium P3]KWW40648.1 MAG: acyl-ACP thioesterase [bacterium F083]